jgi:hypothetical protein
MPLLHYSVQVVLLLLFSTDFIYKYVILLRLKCYFQYKMISLVWLRELRGVKCGPTVFRIDY